MASLLRHPRPDVACTPQRTVRWYTTLKLLFLLLVATILLILLIFSARAPSLDAPPPVILAGDFVLGGRGTRGSTVEVTSNGRQLGRTGVAGDGRWQLSATFVAGTYDLEAALIERENPPVSGDAGLAHLIVVDAPTLELTSGSATNVTVDYTLSGRGSPGSTLRLSRNGEPLTTLAVDEDGTWTYQGRASRPSENEFIAEVLDADGAPLAVSAPRQLSVAAAPPTLAQPLQIEASSFGSLTNDAQSMLVAGEADVEGSGEPEARVSLWHQGGHAGGPENVDTDGHWQLRADLRLPPGQRELVVRMESVDGDPMDEATFALHVPSPPTLIVPGSATDADDIHLSGSAEPNATLTLFADEKAVADVDADGSGAWEQAVRLSAGSHQIVARSDNGLQSNHATVHVSLARPVIVDQQRDEDGHPLPGFYGTGRALTQLDLIVAGEIVGKAVVDESGHWRCACTLPPGQHTVYVHESAEPQRESDPFDIVIVNAQKPFVPGLAGSDAPPFSCPDPSPPGVIEGSSYVIGCGETLSGIAVSLDVTAEALLTYNPQITDPPTIYFGQRLNIPSGAACADDPAGP